MRTDLDAYRVLRVNPSATDEAIRAAYRALARILHPDGTSPDHQRMTEINLAYDLLKTPDRRRRYDNTGRPLVGVGPGVPNVGPFPGGPLERRLAATSPDHGVFVDFGRYAGWRITDIARHDPDYLRWLSRHSAGIRYRAAIERCLPGEKDLGRRTAWVR